MEGFIPPQSDKGDGGQTQGLAFGVRLPDVLSYIQVTKPGGLQIGDRRCEPGDVVRVEQKSHNIMPVDRRLGMSRAKVLIQQGHAIRHAGPATVSTQSMPTFAISPPAKAEESEIEKATLTPSARGAQQAVSARGKAGAI